MPAPWLSSLSQKASRVRMLHPVYTSSLGRPDVGVFDFNAIPMDMFPGDAGRGRWLVSGQFDIVGRRETFDCEGWYMAPDQIGRLPFTQCHSFDWILDMKALGGAKARQVARRYTQGWLDVFQGYSDHVWGVSCVAHRLVNWLVVYPFVFETAPDDFSDNFKTSFYKQFQHLKNNILSDGFGDYFDRLTALWGVLMVQTASDYLYDSLEYSSYLQLLKNTVNDLVDDDGLCIDRTGQNTIELLIYLVRLRHFMHATHRDVPQWMHDMVQKLDKMRMALSMGDKNISLMQGGGLVDKGRWNALQSILKSKIRKQDRVFEASGYITLKKGQTSIVIDAKGAGACLSPASFELCYGRYRMITPCGMVMDDVQWQQALQGMPAHNCLVVDGAPDLSYAQLSPKYTMEKANGAALVSVSHQGYRADFGMTHTRRFYCDEGGEDIRGEDILVRNVAIKPVLFTIRFHVHPDVKVSLVDGGASVLMRLHNGVGWTFMCSDNADISVEDSVFCGDGVHIKKTSQIVLSAHIAGLNETVKWSFKKV